jgi:hypothetical protein
MPCLIGLELLQYQFDVPGENQQILHVTGVKL